MRRAEINLPGLGKRKLFDLDLSGLYGAPGRAVYDDPRKTTLNPRSAALIEGMKNCEGSPPLSHNGNILLSGEEQYYALCDLEEGYYPSRADKKIIADYLDHFVECSKGRVYVSLCSGYAHKDAMIFEMALKEYVDRHHTDTKLTRDQLNKIKREIWPTHVVLVDKSGTSLKNGATNFQNIGYPKDNIITIKADVLKPDLFDRLRGIAEKSGNGQMAVTMLGATFNDFDKQQRISILQNFCKLPDGSHFLVSIDNSTDKTVLEKAYVNARMRQLFLAGAEHALWARTRFDPRKATVNIEVRPHENGQFIHFEVTDPHNHIRWNPIEKIPISETHKEFQEARTVVITPLALEFRHHKDVGYVIYDVVSEDTLAMQPSRQHPKFSAAECRY